MSIEMKVDGATDSEAAAIVAALTLYFSSMPVDKHEDNSNQWVIKHRNIARFGKIR